MRTLLFLAPLALLAVSVVADDDHACKKEFDRLCGKKVDEFEDAVEDFKVFKMIKLAGEIVECVFDHAEDLKDKCFGSDDLIASTEADMKYILSASESLKQIVGDDKDDCKKIVKEKCGDEIDDLEDELEEGGSPKDVIKKAKKVVECLTDNKDDIEKKCKDSKATIQVAVADDDHACKKEFDRLCGKKVDEFEDAVEDFKVFKMIKLAGEIVECVFDHAEDLKDKCFGSENLPASTEADMKYILSASESLKQIVGDDKDDCKKVIKEKCGDEIDELEDALEGGGSPKDVIKKSKKVIECLTDNKDDIEKKCKEGGGDDDDSDCKKEFEKQCGDKVEEFEDAAEDFKIFKMIRLAGEIVKCIFDHAEDLKEECFGDDDLIASTEADMKYILSASESLKQIVGDDKDDCKKIVKEKCGDEIDDLEDELEEGGSPKDVIKKAKKVVECLTDNKDDIEKKCKDSKDIKSQLSVLRGSSDDDSECKKEFEKLCGDKMDEFEEAVDDFNLIDIIKSAGGIVECVFEHAKDLRKKCTGDDDLFISSAADMKYIISKAVVPNQAVGDDKDDCKKIVKEKCGDEIDDLEDELEEGGSPKDVIKKAKKVVECLTDNKDDIEKKCKDSIINSYQLPSTPAVDEESKCHRALYNKCGKPINKLKDAVDDMKVLKIVRYAVDSASCIAENAKYILDQCTSSDDKKAVVARSRFTMAKTGKDEESKCHKELYNKCGNDLDSLKKAIDNSDPNGVMGSSLKVAGCITNNFAKIVEACNPFKDQELDAVVSESNLMFSHSMNYHDEKSFVGEIKGMNFDFHQCVEMAKFMVIRDYFDHHQNSGAPWAEQASTTACHTFHSLNFATILIGTAIVIVALSLIKAIKLLLIHRNRSSKSVPLVSPEKAGYVECA